jgi:hypothetical protein
MYVIAGKIGAEFEKVLFESMILFGSRAQIENIVSSSQTGH